MADSKVNNNTAQAVSPPERTASATNGTTDEAAGVTCVACGQENTPDSRFCRYCGATLQAGAATGGENANGATKPADAASAGTAATTMTAATTAVSTAAVTPDQAQQGFNEGPELTPEEIDVRRSRHLLDRALHQAEHGDKAAAVLSCRQAVALAPNEPAGYSMLGLLLERNGDIPHAVAAYQKVLELAPNSPLERDSLQRLRGEMEQSKASSLFNFNASELYSAEAIAADAPAASTEAAAAMAAPVAAATAMPVATDAVPPVPAVNSNAVAPVAPPILPDVGAESAAAAALRAANAVLPASGAAMTVPPIAPLAGLELDVLNDGSRPAAPRWLRRLNGESSFYLQSAPLVLAAVLGLPFLMWARGVAVSRAVSSSGGTTYVQTGNSQTMPDESGQTQAQTQGTDQTPTNGAAPSANNNFSFPITNAPGVGTGQPAQGGAAPSGTGASGAGPASPAGGAPSASRTSGSRSAGRSGSGPFDGIPPFAPNKAASPAPTPIVVSGPGNSSSTGSRGGTSGGGITGGTTSRDGAPLPLDGGGARGTIRITSHAPVASAPPRPDNRASADEEAARAAASAGNTDAAIERTSAAIDTGRNDTAWRYQQRALLRLEKGDNDHAADDFQLALAAYRDQLARGVRVNEARDGIAACQSGLKLARQRG